ncbi:MAG: cytochrome bc1 complex cytochrome b subunit, partial [Acidimicrobiales bacterium]
LEPVTNWLDDRLTTSGVARKALNKIFPDHWSFMLGEIALYSFIILVLTGIFLTLYFVPSVTTVTYHGPYKPLDGTKVTQAYASTIDLSFTVRFGLVMRQMHHWAADVFIGAIVVHMCRIFFTGAFRRPRELNWIVGVTLLMLSIFNGFIGYSLPDDLVSGTGLRIAFSILESIPIVGSYLAFWLFGGNYPGASIIPRFYIIHVLLLPLAIIGLLTAHLAIMTYQKHTQFPGKGKTNSNVVGSVLWPTYTAKTIGYFLFTTSALAVMAAIVQINPIWQYGVYIPYHVSYAVQPDWYMGWLDGALRIMPAWEIVFPGHMIPNAFFPSVLLPGLTFALLWVWPFIENRFTREGTVEHHLLDRPRDRPLRTAIGAGVFAFYGVLFGASATDVLANFFGLSLNSVLWGFRAAVIVVPIITGLVAYRICVELQTWTGVGERKRPMIILRNAEGAYLSVPANVRPGDKLPELEPIEVPEETGVHVGGAFAHGSVVGDGDGDGHGAGDGEVPVGSHGGSGVLLAPRGPRSAPRSSGFLASFIPKRLRP